MTNAVNPAARSIALAAALLGFVAVVLAALANHVLNLQASPQLQRIWQTASIIHMFHAASLLALSALLTKWEVKALRRGAWLMVIGTVIFCGSVYIRVIFQLASAVLAPFGGLLLMAAWLLVAWSMLRSR